MLPSEATEVLRQRMFGNLERPDPVVEARQKLPSLRVSFLPWREEAAERILDGARRGELSVWVWREGQAPILLASSIVGRLITVRGGLPDFPFRVPWKLVKEGLATEQLCVTLENGVLILDRNEFSAWCEKQHRRQIWPSQEAEARRRASSPQEQNVKPRRGRPSRRTETVRNAVLALIEDGVWDAREQTVEGLCRLLRSRSCLEVPSRDTVRRLVDDLFREKGKIRLQRVVRRRRRPAP